jgi:hypothetical protein
MPGARPSASRWALPHVSHATSSALTPALASAAPGGVLPSTLTAIQNQLGHGSAVAGLFPSKSKPDSAAPASELDTGLGANARAIVVFDHLHLRHQVGDLDQLLCRAAPGQHHVQLGAFVLQRLQHHGFVELLQAQ